MAIVLLIGYAAGLWFSLVSPTATSSTRPSDEERTDDAEPWSIKRSVILLAPPASRSG